MLPFCLIFLCESVTFFKHPSKTNDLFQTSTHWICFSCSITTLSSTQSNPMLWSYENTSVSWNQGHIFVQDYKLIVCKFTYLSILLSLCTFFSRRIYFSNFYHWNLFVCWVLGRHMNYYMDVNTSVLIVKFPSRRILNSW